MPTAHISDVDTWGAPDRNYYVFIVLSFIFGFFGLDHFYLRSFGTGTQKLFMNILGLGIWYFWDLAQILTEGDKIRKEGLSSPFDWIRGIGRGVFTEGFSGGSMANKSYLVYTFLAVFFGWLGADKFYMGAAGQGLAKLVSCFNIFFVLFGLIWVVYDAYNAFFNTRGILENGITPPMPYNLFFDKIDSKPFIVGSGASTGDVFSQFFGWLPGVPDFSFIKNTTKEILPLVVTPPIVKAIKSVGEMPQMPQMPQVPQMPQMPSSSLMPSASAALAAANPVAAVAAAVPSAPPTQAGGGAATGGPGPIIAGVLTALVLAGGLKGTYDFISKL